MEADPVCNKPSAGDKDEAVQVSWDSQGSAGASVNTIAGMICKAELEKEEKEARQ